jgi:N-acetylmuramoyl-L-alanine amidase
MKIYLSPSSQWGNPYVYNGYNEAQVCGMISQRAKIHLERNGYEAISGDNVKKDMVARVKESNAVKANIHMPIHTNAFNGKAEGTVVFAFSVSVGNKYVKAVYEEIAALSPGKDRGIKANDGLYEVGSAVNATTIYIEVEFHDNPEHSKWIVDSVDQIAQAIARGYCKADGKEYIPPEGAYVEPEIEVPVVEEVKPVIPEKTPTKRNAFGQKGPKVELKFYEEPTQIVKELQSILIKKGYDLLADGYAGPVTFKTVSNHTVEKGERHAIVGWVQKKLTSLGYRPGNIDNYAGPMTMAAIYSFQQDHGLGIGFLGGTDWYYLLTL